MLLYHKMKDLPIGIFDSGIGGLTVARAIAEVLPHESFIYLGDTARVPYGTRGKEVITQFALELTKYLLERKVKLLVVACNTISATCLDKIQQISPVPVVGVILPAADQAARQSKGKVGVLGTRATISSGAYEQALRFAHEKEIKKLSPDIEVVSKACPLFVPIAEEGLGRDQIAKMAAEEYLGELKGKVDTLVLGCTHYPLLREVIQEVVGADVTLIDSAEPTAQEVKRVLTEENLLNEGSSERQFLVTDAPERVLEIAKLFFGNELVPDVELAKL